MKWILHELHHLRTNRPHRLREMAFQIVWSDLYGEKAVNGIGATLRLLPAINSDLPALKRSSCSAVALKSRHASKIQADLQHSLMKALRPLQRIAKVEVVPLQTDATTCEASV